MHVMCLQRRVAKAESKRRVETESAIRVGESAKRKTGFTEVWLHL